MKKTLSNCNVTLISEEPMHENRFYLGYGQVQGNNNFRFETESAVVHKKNPLAFKGKVLKVRATKAGQLRCTAVCPNVENPLRVRDFFNTLALEAEFARNVIYQKMTGKTLSINGFKVPEKIA